MGALTPSFKKALIDDIISGITSNTNYYYAFASSPVPTFARATPVVTDSNNTIFIPDNQMLFGKKLSNTDVVPMIKKITWVFGDIYDRYDDTDPDLLSKNYYVITSPAYNGGFRDVYICLDNANGSPSTAQPDIVQPTAFKKQSDGYVWRYITSINNYDYERFSSANYVPVYSNTALSLNAYIYAGIDVIKINKTGNGHVTYANGTLQSAPETTRLQLETINSSNTAGFYNNCSIYIVNPLNNVSELKNIVNYYTDASGRWAVLDEPANTVNIIPNVTTYYISPRVVFETDGDVEPKAYSVINPSGNVISSIVIVNSGSNITTAKVFIQNNYSNFNPSFVQANLQAIISPPGGYGYDPVSQLNAQGIGINFTFANTESNTIPTNLTYNKIGLMKNPKSITKISGNTTVINDFGGEKSIYAWTNATFNQLLSANINPQVTYSIGDIIIGANSRSTGVIAQANDSVIYMVGQKKFLPSEVITSESGLSTVMTINKDISNTYITGDIYTKDIQPLYIQNVDDVERSNTQTEEYKLIIQV